MATKGPVPDSLIESQNATDPTSDPEDAITTGIQGKEATSIPPPLTPALNVGTRGEEPKAPEGARKEESKD